MSLAAGTRLGVYEVIGAIGAGGMGEVYRARDTKLNRDVALKVLPASVADDPERLARFRREAQVLAALNHPHIAQIYGFEDSSSTHALVMELVEGETLDEIIQRGLAPDTALSIARQIADAVEVAHDQGIVHRDLKPANVKVKPDGMVKVLDFGLAKAADPTRASGQSIDPMNSPTFTAHATELGLVVGTAGYMAPEQAKGKAVDRRADIWAFGVVLYEMFSGRRAFQADNITETLAAVLTRDVDMNALTADTPPRVRALIRDCLVREPRMRLRDIGDARIALEKTISGTQDVDLPTSSMPGHVSHQPAWRKALPWAIAAAAVLVAGFVTWRAMRAPPPPTRPVTRSKVVLKDLAGFVNISRDGTSLVYTVAGPKGFYLALRRLDQFEAQPIAGSEAAVFPIFSPDAEWIAYSTSDRPSRIRKLRATGGPSAAIADGSFDRGAAWSRDDTIVFAGATGLMRVSAAGGTPEPLTSLDQAQGETAHTRPRFLPGERQLVFTVLKPKAPTPAEFAVLDLATGKHRIVAKGGDNGAYAPSGHLTFVRSGTLYAVPVDQTTLVPIGPETPVAEGISNTGPAGTADYTFADTGLLVYSENLADWGTTLASADRSGAVRALPGQVSRDWGTGRLSPDGRRVACGLHDGKGGTDIWVSDLQRGITTRLTFGGENDNPIWTPDGRTLLYGSTQGEKSGLYSVPADGSGRPELLLAAPRAVVPTSMTPDGKTVLFTPTGGSPRIQVLTLAAPSASRQPRALHETSSGEGGAQLSRDGKWVAYESFESGTLEIYLHPFPGPAAKTRISTDGGRSVRWAPGGRELFYWTNTTGVAGLIAVAIQLTPSVQVKSPRTLFQMGAGSTWDVMTDNQFLVELPRVGGPASATFAAVTDWFDELRRRAPPKK